MKDPFYRNKVVLVTGASRGIGKEIVHQVLSAGGKVIATGRDLERLHHLVQAFAAYQDRLITCAGNVASYEDNRKVVETGLARFGRIDIVFANAGISGYGNLAETDPSADREIIDINLFGCLFLAKACMPALAQTKGSILFVSSIAGHHGIPAHAAYSLSKMALRGLSQALSIEWRDAGIFVGIAYLGFTQNDGTKTQLNPSGELEKVPPRPKWLTASREKTVRAMLRQVAKKKNALSYGTTGRTIEWMSRLFPGLLHAIMRYQYKKAPEVYDHHS
jgi:NAD(P)-dependent dehydrogenase (short-subunit alcohol dehydrogenase family)